MRIAAKIVEMGNGYSATGDFLRGRAAGMHRLVAADSRIHTGRAAGGYIYDALEEPASDAGSPEARAEL